jgi:hypothetical protein
MVDAADIAVAVKDEVVILSGFVRTYAEKLAVRAGTFTRQRRCRRALNFGRDIPARRTPEWRLVMPIAIAAQG